MKYPYLKFFTGDYLKDPRLSLCHPASRGVWVDLLCAMHELDRSGELRGTSEELARLARCSTVQLDQALTDLQNKLAADIEQRNGVWTIANRRMKREADIQGKRAKAGSKGGKAAQANREQTPYDNDCDSDDLALGRVREFARGKGIKEVDADWFFWKGKGNGWTNRGEQILDWKATLLCWSRAGYLPSQKQHGIIGDTKMTFVRPKEKAPSYPQLPEKHEPTEEELAKAKAIMREASARLREQMRLP